MVMLRQKLYSMWRQPKSLIRKMKECRKKAQKHCKGELFVRFVPSSGNYDFDRAVPLIGTVAPAARLWLNDLAVTVPFVSFLCAP